LTWFASRRCKRHISLRQEIVDLRNMNARFSSKGDYTPIDQSALEARTNRLLEIKKELSKMLNRPEDPSVWWEKFGRSNRAAQVTVDLPGRAVARAATR
jgi:hypothetical protein